ncbi:MAG TPA: hypothetical protein VEZ14_04200 [Dehalococcoidia bacterium]|nr:hypothetical protein [Dehalococcoidia bacterium]
MTSSPAATVSASPATAVAKATTAKVASGGPNALAKLPANAPTVVLQSGTPLPFPTFPPDLAPSTPVGAATPQPSVTVVAPPLPTVPVDAPPPPAPTASAAFFVSAPATATGEFTVTVGLTGNVPPYKGFGILLEYDSSIVQAEPNVTEGNLFPDAANTAFCPTAAVSPTVGVKGSILWGCVRVGPDTVQNIGVAGVFHFKTVGHGVTRLHLVSYQEAGSAGTLLLNPNSDPLSVDTVDGVVTVP